MKPGTITIRTFRNTSWAEVVPRVSLIRRVSRARMSQSAWTPPVGWSIDDTYYEIEIGPSWLIVPRQFCRQLRYRFFEWASKHDLVQLEEDGFFADARWFPTQPRFTDIP